MATTCCAVPGRSSVPTGALAVCLTGNPNVGKSTIFNRLTGASVETANYAGMTVGVTGLATRWAEQEVYVFDLPGTYAVGASGVVGDDQGVAWRHLLVESADVVVVVVDATNVARNLYMVLQLIDLGFPVVVALNLMDVAVRRSLQVDVERLSAGLGVPVVATVGSGGRGIDGLKEAVVGAAAARDSAPPRRHFSAEVEARLEALEERLEPRLDLGPLPFGLTPRATAVALLEGIDDVTCALDAVDGGDAVTAGVAAGDRWGLRIARERHRAARDIADRAITRTHAGMRGSERLWRAATRPATGVPILFGVLAMVFVVLFTVGDLLSTTLTRLWETGPGPLIDHVVRALIGTNIVSASLLWGLNGGILAALAVGIPYILTFYFILALLEDSGYMNAAAFLSDRVMHRFGLHGQAAIPLVAAAGCNVPAVLATRSLPTRRERLIASWLITLTPCSARTAVIVGSVALLVGWQWALFVYGIVFAVAIASTLTLGRLLPGEPGPLVMEVFPIRRPAMSMVVRKTWTRFREFVWVAAPIIIGGSIALGFLYESGLLLRLEPLMQPVVGWWLGLPAVAGVTLIFAVLRKELALQLLVVFAVTAYGAAATDLRTFMSGDQIIVYALVNAIYIPCIATIAVLGRELGRRSAALITAGTVVTALLVGGAVAHLLPYL